MDKEIRKQNRLAAGLLLLGFVLALVIMSLPVYSFQTSVYTKKSANTVIGDEKYTEVRAEVEAVAEDYINQGFQVEISEDVLERTNSKGETSSLVTFTISETQPKNLFVFLGESFSSSHVLRIILACMILSVICAVAGLIGSQGMFPKYLPRRARILRSASGWLALISLVLTPVFAMMNTYNFSRRVYLYSNDLIQEGRETFYGQLDRFLFGGTAGDNIESVVNKLDISCSWMLWILLLCFFLLILGAVQLRYGTVKSTLLRGFLYFFIIIVCIVTLYPYYVMLITALRNNAETLDMYFLHIFPTEWKFQNLLDIINKGVPQYLLNSLLVAGGATLLAMVCGIPAAYALARMQFYGKKVFLGFIIMSQMFSPVVLLIGLSQLMTTLNLSDSVVGLMLINAAFNQAFAIWLLRGTFVSISPEMEQAAMIDGCSTAGSLTRVLLPMAAPGIVTALIFVFINAWNEFTIANVLISTSSNRPITVGITRFSSFNMIEWEYLFAASLVATIPVVILFILIEKHLTSGLTSGGVKG